MATTNRRQTMISQAKIKKYIKARYPGFRRNNAAEGWMHPDGWRFISDRDARAEAEAELEAAGSGIAHTPEWAK